MLRRQILSRVKISGTTMGLLLMVLATILFASMHSMVRYAGGDLHPFVLVFFRNFFSLLVVIPLIMRVGRGALKSSHYSLLFLRGVIGITAMLSWFYGLVHVPITEATTLSFTAAIFTVLSAIIFLGERVHFRRWAAIGCGFIGVLVVLRPNTDNFNPVMLMILFSAMFWALSITLIKYMSKTDTPTSLVAWMSIILTVLSFPFALYYWQWPVGEQWLWLMAIGVLGSLGHLCMVRALALADITAVMSIDFFRLVWSALIGVYFFGDQMRLATWVGAAIIFASGLYIIFRESEVSGGQ